MGVGAGQGLRLEAQVLQASGPWPPNKLCAMGWSWGSRERLGMVGLGGEVLSDPLMTLPSPLYFSLLSPSDSLDTHFPLILPPPSCYPRLPG